MKYLYRCDYCGNYHTMQQWHETTADALGIGVEQIHHLDDEDADECFYYCPTCMESMDGEVIEVSLVAPNNNAEALSLLND